MATTMVNGVTNVDGNSTNNAVSTPGKQPAKPNLGSKAGDGPRKPMGPQNDASQRKPPQKAWQSGMNPITQRSTTPASQNGSISQAKSGPQKPTPAMEAGTADRHAHDRLLFLMTHFLGLCASITVKGGDIFSGVFYGASLEGNGQCYLLKMAQKVKQGDKCEANGNYDDRSDFIGFGEDHIMPFDMKDVIHLAVDSVTFDIREKAQNAGFRTDADISGNLALRERNLQRWEPSADAEIDTTLEGTGGAWDQFQANEQRFGLKSDYDESFYTTSIDKSHPDFRRREAEALRIAQEIEGGSADNTHVREERGISQSEDAMGEEEKYSGVHRQATEYPPLQLSQANRYMPPARRPPTGKPTVAGAPVDPAIISMQMASAGTDQVENQPSVKEDQDGIATSNIKPTVSPEVGREASKPASSSNQSIGFAPRQTAPIKTSQVRESATANVETELLDSFKQFASNEKMKFHDQRRQRVTHDKNIKLNDLMKFSQNFKLLTPVPKDLVPILAKDKAKQEAIIEKAQRNAESAESHTTSGQATEITSNEVKASKRAAETTRPAPEVSSNRQIVPPQGPQAPQAGRERPQQLHNGASTAKAGPGLLSHRLADSHRQHKAGLQPVSIPQPIPIQSVSKSTRASGNNNSQMPTISARTPTSASSASAKFNVRAMEFRPNPAANSFRPTGEPSTSSSPRSTPHARSASRPLTPSAFFGNRKPLPREERESILAHFNPLKRLKEISQQEGRTPADNGGIRHAYVTPPTWSLPGRDEEFISYKQMFDDVPQVPDQVSSQHGSPSHPSLPHQHQLPVQLQQGPHVMPHLSPSHQAPFHSQPQPPQFPTAHHYDDHRMHLSASTSSIYPSPRMQSASMVYPSPMPQPAQITYGPPMPQYFMGPGGPQPGHFSRHFASGPQMMPAQGPPLAAPMMVQQSSQGGYIGPPQSMPIPFNPQVTMYPPGQPAGYTASSQPSTNYPSPSRGAPMMMHQGSHQGQHSQVFPGPGQYTQPVYVPQQPTYMMPFRGYSSPQPHYSQSPQPQYHHAHQPGRTPSGNYSVGPPQGPHQHLPAQQPPPSGPMDGGEEMK
ncbi:MAG: hypothetical protein Q9170_005151 [Blastenia crenularia]